ncbi:hypothetical protein [Streptomyces syringium]|uniref:hypothetical protein n=1 Tax=Streptomyces syringium TaxID=76729 RepID=UPI0034519438
MPMTAGQAQAAPSAGTITCSPPSSGYSPSNARHVTAHFCLKYTGTGDYWAYITGYSRHRTNLVWSNDTNLKYNNAWGIKGGAQCSQSRTAQNSPDGNVQAGCPQVITLKPGSYSVQYVLTRLESAEDTGWGDGQQVASAGTTANFRIAADGTVSF